ncbi:universal stress protein [Luteococcus peritonei]|uniref:Universal stress protein n=1 Tax=Luteococcus peritonei TaxID=88874 RepID=A0ABW4RTC7_9ACTN
MSTENQERPYTVVVGINGSQQSRDALRWAKAQADLHGGRVIALRTWRAAAPAATPSGTSAGRVGTTERTEKEVREALATAVESALGSDHGVELRVERTGRKKAFVELSKRADLIVLGAPRKMAAGPMFAHRLVYATHCPVVVMPPEPTGPSVVSRAAGAAADRLATAAGTAGRPGMPPRPPVR